MSSWPRWANAGFLIKPILSALLVLGLVGPEPASAQDATGRSSFAFRSTGPWGPTPVLGRLLIYMTVNDKPLEVIEPGFGSEVKSVWIIAREVQSLAPGAEVVLDVGDPTYPQPLTHAPAADYQVMALLDVDHNKAYTRSTRRTSAAA